MTYPELPANLLDLEEEMLDLWRKEKLFEATLEATADGEPFVFYEGPPTANGRPGLHHIISRTTKDLVCRHRTMTGRSVTRIAGWDTHGLPVEIEAEKKLGISGKPQIEEIGIARFNEVCRDSVFTYKKDWEAFSERIGYWLDYSRPYVTYHTEYIESVWWILKELAERELLYRGHKSVPYCPRCGTGLSSHEVAQGYEDVEDPSLFFLCPLLGADGGPDADGRALLVWTTTPWTVPSNTAVAVHPELIYAEVEADGRRVLLAEDRVEAVLGEGVEILARHRGAELAGMRYQRPLELVDVTEEEARAGWYILPGDFVSAEDGTGIVHMAPAFGADDYATGQRHGLPLLQPLDDAGHFREAVPLVGGLFVKDADPVIVEALDAAGMLFRIERETHSYPHCWRCSSPLIYMARSSWFAATSTVKDRMLANNREVGWNPPEVGTGRFGEWLENNVDWALSRDRFWGTPIPVWICDRDPERVEWIGSLAELAERSGALPDDFDPHRPFVDEITWPCPDGCGGTMRRTPEVVDVWFDSGAMPYAQWHYPYENRDAFERHFPADFICEALDQTRGWFYSLMAISTMLDRGPAYRNVIVNGLILDAEGQKMSKSKGNTVDPWDAIGELGADALRWYLITVSQPWTAKRYDPEGVRESARRFFDTFFNSYRFFTLYANVEEWAPSDEDPAPERRSILDRWLLSRLNRLVAEVSDELDRYQVTRAYRLVSDFLNEELSNWYVRRSRPRFWGNTDAEDARAAFRTLWDALRTVSLLVAPVTPFFGDWMHRALAGGSAHLAPFPASDEALLDGDLEREMAAVRELVSLGRAAREEVQIKVRQPLRKLYAVLPSVAAGSAAAAPPTIRPEVLDVLKDELNVKEVVFLSSAEHIVRLVARPNFRSLGPRFQKRSELAATAIRGLSSETLAAFRRGEEVAISLEGTDHALQPEELEIVEEAEGDFIVRSQNGYTAALDPTLDDELLGEGVARELVNRIQRLRKESGLEITDRIELWISGSAEVEAAAADFTDFIRGETLAVRLDVGGAPPDEAFDADREIELDGVPVRIALGRAGS
ncbi:MAG: isoleucine--tRNA ligase [Gemmatimonadota bacterium]